MRMQQSEVPLQDTDLQYQGLYDILFIMGIHASDATAEGTAPTAFISDE